MVFFFMDGVKIQKLQGSACSVSKRAAFSVSVVREDLLMLKGLKKLPAAVELSMLNIKQMVDFDTWVKVG